MKRAWDDATPEQPVAVDPVVERAARGDHRAFEALFRRHAPWVSARLRRMLGPRADVEDLVQEVFLRAHRSLASYRGQARFEAWLRRICARVAYDEIRSGRARPRLDLVDAEPTAADTDHERREAARHLMRMIEALPARNRMVLVLHDVEGYTADEIRLVVGARSVNTVHSRLRLARSELHRRAAGHPALRWLYGKGGDDV